MENRLILGARSSTEDIHYFQQMKLALKEMGYPLKETSALVDESFLKIREKIVSVADPKTLIIKVPSGSGTNKITYLFAKQLSKATGASVLPETLVSKLHKGEAKRNLSLRRRNEDPIHYRLVAREIRSIARAFDKVLVLDDLIGSGESSVKLKKALEAGGIKIYGLVNLVTVENRSPQQADMQRLFKKIDSQLNLPFLEKLKLQEDIQLIFGEYTRIKLNRVERLVTDQRSALAALKDISDASVIELQFKKRIKKSLSR